jgi:hypothetical protein
MRREAHDAETLLGRVTERGDRNHHSGPDAKRSREQKGDVLGSASATGATSQLGINDRINFKKDGNSVFSATGKTEPRCTSWFFGDGLHQRRAAFAQIAREVASHVGEARSHDEMQAQRGRGLHARAFFLARVEPRNALGRGVGP